MTLKKISPEDLYKKLGDQEKVILLDVRSEDKYNDYHIEDPKIENLNIVKTKILDNEETALESLPRDKEIIVTCTTGNSATKCATALSEMDFDAVVLEGGITAWKEFLETK